MTTIDPRVQRALDRAAQVITATQQRKTAVETAADTAAGMLAAGQIHEHENGYVEAIRWYECAIHADPDLHEARARLAIALLKSGDKDDAARVAVELVERAPDFKFPSLGGRPTSAPTVLADALGALDQPDQALALYMKALTVEPQDGYAAGRAAELWLRAGNLEEALTLSDQIEVSERFETLRSVLALGAQDAKQMPAVSKISLYSADAHI